MMSLKKIIALVNKEKKLYVCREGRTQWVGTGGAMYPINKLPPMSLDEFAFMMDIPSDSKARNKYFIKELDEGTLGFVSSNIHNAEPVQLNRWVFNRGSNSFLPLITTQGLMFLNSTYLDPIDDSDMRNICECYNPDDGHHYIVVKTGLYVMAVIELSHYVLDREVQDELRDMLRSLDRGAYGQRQTGWW